MLTGGCHFAKSRTTDAGRAGDAELSVQNPVQNPPQSDSGAVEASERCRQLAEENERFRKELKTKELDITKLTADLQYMTKKNQHLEEIRQSIQQDLDQAEKQFISIEQRLQLKETKASAVSSLAEARLAYDKYKSIQSKTTDVGLLEEIERKLEESRQLIDKDNYPASVYYSKRVHRMLERSASNEAFLRSNGETRVVSVSKANLRKGPGLDYEVIGQVIFGTVLVQVELSDKWSKIETQDGVVGWIHRDLIR